MPGDSSSTPVERVTRRALWRRVAGWTVRVLGALVLALLLAEGALRILGARLPPRPPHVNTHLVKSVSDENWPGLGLVLRRGSSGESVYPGVDGEEERRVSYKINGRGFRDRQMTVEKPPGTYRIAMLGDSFTYGTGLDIEDTLSRQLERELSALLPETPIQVINCGVPATHAGEQVALLRYRVRQIQPDMVIITASLEDTAGFALPSRKNRGPRWESEWILRLGLTSGRVEDDTATLSPAQARLQPWRHRSVLVDLLANKTFAYLHGRLASTSYHENWMPDAPGVARLREVLGDAAAMAREDGFALRVHLYPSLLVLTDEYPFATEIGRFADICRDLDIPFLDLLEPLLGADAASLRVHPHDRHPSAEAHALVTPWIAQRILPVIEADIAAWQ